MLDIKIDNNDLLKNLYKVTEVSNLLVTDLGGLSNTNALTFISKRLCIDNGCNHRLSELEFIKDRWSIEYSKIFKLIVGLLEEISSGNDIDTKAYIKHFSYYYEDISNGDTCGDDSDNIATTVSIDLTSIQHLTKLDIYNMVFSTVGIKPTIVTYHVLNEYYYKLRD